jgi:hypothetical protein
MHDARVDSTDSASELASLVESERPPVVITRGEEAEEISNQLDGYREFRGEGRQRVGGQSSLVFVVYVDATYAGERGEPPGHPLD